MSVQVTKVADILPLIAKHSLKSHLIASLKYFTTWVTLLVIAYKVSSKYIDMLFLTSFVLFASSIFSMIVPGYIKYQIDSNTYIISGNACLIINILFHVAPFVLVAAIRQKSGVQIDNSIRLGNAFLLLLLYIISYDVRDIYDANGDMLAKATACFLVIYCSLI